MLDVSDDVRAEIGDDEADRLLAGENAPGSYDCTSCRAPGDLDREHTSTVLFIGDETAVLAFAHAGCLPSQVVRVAEEQLRGAVRSIGAEGRGTGPDGGGQAGGGFGGYGAPASSAPSAHAVPDSPQVPRPQTPQTSQTSQMPQMSQMSQAPNTSQMSQVPPGPSMPSASVPSPGGEPVMPGGPVGAVDPAQGGVPKLVPEQAVLGVTSGLVLICGELHPALVVEPTSPIVRPGTVHPGDDFLTLLTEQGFMPVAELSAVPPVLHGWSVLLAMGQLHAVLQPGPDGGSPVAWWQAHQPLAATDSWRAAANKHQQVLMFAAPVGSIGRQPREDLLRAALDRAAANGRLVAAALPLAGL